MARSRWLLALLAVLALSSTAALAFDRGSWQREHDVIWPAEYANPDIVSLGGGAYRAYLMSSSGIVSAYSTNGKDFTLEPGVRVAGEHHALAQLSDGRLRLYYSRVDSGGVISAVSEDGLNFTAEPGLRLASKRGERPIHLDVIRAGKGWRMYYDADAGAPGQMDVEWRGIRSAYSEDGLAFERERGWRINTRMAGLRSFADLVWSPFAERRGGNVDLLFSVETDEQPKKRAGIWRARSANGRRFELRPGPELGIDPAVGKPKPGPGGTTGLPQDAFVLRVEGGVRLFYWQARQGTLSAFK